MYRIVKGALFEYYPMYIVCYFPDGLDEKEVESIIEKRSYQTIGVMEIVEGKKQVYFPFNPASAFNRGFDRMELEKWEEIFEVIRKYVDANEL